MPVKGMRGDLAREALIAAATKDTVAIGGLKESGKIPRGGDIWVDSGSQQAGKGPIEGPIIGEDVSSGAGWGRVWEGRRWGRGSRDCSSHSYSEARNDFR